MAKAQILIPRWEASGAPWKSPGPVRSGFVPRLRRQRDIVTFVWRALPVVNLLLSFQIVLLVATIVFLFRITVGFSPLKGNGFPQSLPWRHSFKGQDKSLSLPSFTSPQKTSGSFSPASLVHASCIFALCLENRDEDGCSTFR